MHLCLLMHLPMSYPISQSHSCPVFLAELNVKWLCNPLTVTWRNIKKLCEKKYDPVWFPQSNGELAKSQVKKTKITISWNLASSPLPVGTTLDHILIGGWSVYASHNEPPSLPRTTVIHTTTSSMPTVATSVVSWPLYGGIPLPSR
jgi:hypothetical protein